jgi:hypothetical protein
MNKELKEQVRQAEKNLLRATKAEGLNEKDQLTLPCRSIWLADGVGEVLIYPTNIGGIVFNYKGCEYATTTEGLKDLVGQLLSWPGVAGPDTLKGGWKGMADLEEPPWESYWDWKDS